MKDKLLQNINTFIQSKILKENSKTENYSFLEDLDEKIVSEKEKDILPLNEQLKFYKKITLDSWEKFFYFLKNFFKKLYTFEYKDFKNEENNFSWTIRGSNKIEAASNAKLIYKLNYDPLKVLPIEFQKDRLIDKIIANPTQIFSSRKVNKMQLWEFLKEYADLREDEFSKEDTIDNLKDSITDKTLKEFIDDLRTTSFKMSQLMKQIWGFDDYTITIIESAESSWGTSKFHEWIKHLWESYIQEEKFKKEFIGSLILPIWLLVVILILVYGFLKLVMPSLYGLFSELVWKNWLPAYMTTLLEVWNNLEFTLLKIWAVVFWFIFILKILSSNIFILVKWNLLKLKIPLYWSIIKIIEENRIARILIQTIDSNLSPLDKIQSFEKSTSNELYKRVYRYMYKIYPLKQNVLNTFIDANDKFGWEIFSKRFIGLLKIAKWVKQKILEKYLSFLTKNMKLLLDKMGIVKWLTTTLITITIAWMIGSLFTLITTLVLNVTSKM